ncbi:cell cycle checkpoint control protein RAD9B isoform X1 [Ascaphus truei]|uniref:cell cycle checkpoint control protein RAD9B isoform X1 n=2 Tax=Ascaphus truei TaxID=8439 RepID=UPI003F5AB4F2
MECVIPGSHVKVFGKAIHSLSKISDELWFDPVEKGLALRAVNSSRSAYACVFFSSLFFQRYHEATIHEQGHGDVLLHFKCKFPMKSVLPVFRSLGALDRNVEKCNIYTNFTDCRVIFQLFCKHGVTKTHHLTYEDCEPLQAVFAKNICPNILKIQSRVLADIMIHFPTCQEEVTLTITPLKVSFKSYTEEAFGFSKAMHTEIHLSPDEFDYIQVGVDTEVTFCLKELRGFLAFADTTSAHISVHFSKPGKPVAFSLEDMVLEANFVLATLTNADSRTSSQRSQHIVLRASPCTPHTDAGNKNTDSLAENENMEDSIAQKQIDTQCSVIRASPKLLTAHKMDLENTKVNPGTEATAPQPSTYNKFCSLFFGAISSKQQEDFNQPFYSLATASDNEEDFATEFSPTF